MIAKSLAFMGAYFAIRNSYSHLCPSSQGEKPFFVRQRFGRTSTSALCLRPCQLRKVATRSYKRYEIFASANQRRL